MEQQYVNANVIMFKSARPYNFTYTVNEQKIRVHVRYNSYKDSYYLNVDRYEKGNYKNLINSIPLTTGVDLFIQHPQFELGSLFVIPTKKEYYDKDPKSETIKDNYMLMWVN